MRVHLVDGTFELYRAHFSPRPGRLAPDGRDVKATLGLVGQMLTLLADKKEAPTHLAVVFDNPIRSFRNDLFDGYKGDEGVPPVLREQFDLVEEAVRALGLAVWSMKDHEADDGLATGAAKLAPLAEQVRILSPDKDMMQCVQGAHVVTVDRIRNREFDEAAVRETWGVAPKQIPDLLALTGDDADGIPGVPGLGKKTAAALIAAFGSVEKIPADPAKWPKAVRGAERLAASLAEARDVVPLYKTLATLVTDAPVDARPEAIAVGQVGGDAFDAFCTRLGAPRLAALARSGASGATA